MTTVLPISQVRANISDLVSNVGLQEVHITVDGKIEAAIIDIDELNSMKATLEVVSDPELVKAIEEGMNDINEGRVHDWEDVKEELGL